MLCLHVQARFATFRQFSAGSFRPSAPFLTYSAAYGLLMNLAGREMRAADDGKSAMTRIATGLPVVDIALGVVGAVPGAVTLFQQLHNYPVGNSGKERAAVTFGNKYNIKPARRGLLHRLDALIAVRGDAALEADIEAGLCGEKPRYGLPFLGDNNFLPDRIDPVDTEYPAQWLRPTEGAVLEDDGGEPMRLTLTIDRADMARTRTGLFTAERGSMGAARLPTDAWVGVGYA